MKYDKLVATAIVFADLRWRVLCASLVALIAALFMGTAARAENLHPQLETARDGQNVIAALHIAIPAEFHAGTGYL